MPETPALYERLSGHGLPRLLQRENRAIQARIVELTRVRHKRYGETLFHLEPNIKDCPGGLRDVHVCGWLAMLQGRAPLTSASDSNRGREDPVADDLAQAIEFLYRVRCFLHYRHERDDNTLDWQAQDAAAAASIGLASGQSGGQSGGQTSSLMPPLAMAPDAAYWMRIYFRHARSIERRTMQVLDAVAPPLPSAFSRLKGRLRRQSDPSGHGFRLEEGRIVLDAETDLGGTLHDPAHDPDVVLRAFAALSENGGTLGLDAEERLAQALPPLSANLEEGAVLWHPLRAILTGRYAGRYPALPCTRSACSSCSFRSFHGIDALVIRDAYHRYTVDEHTFVVIDTLHELEGAPAATEAGTLAEWTGKFASILRDIPHPELLYLGALLHDTGKGSKLRRARPGECTHGEERARPPGARRVREQPGDRFDREPPRHVCSAAARHLRRGDGARLRRQGGHPGGPAHAHALHLR